MSFPRQQALLGIDIGSTHCKAGVFEMDGRLIQFAIRKMDVDHSPRGYQFFDPERLWQKVLSLVSEVIRSSQIERILAVGISSMAETGLLLDRASKKTRSPMIPWFDQSSTAAAEKIAAEFDPRERFFRTGLHPSYKVSLAKILWLRDELGINLENCIWLGAAEYILWKWSGEVCTDLSLAGRTYAFHLEQREWDGEALRTLGIPADLFPGVQPSGAPMGSTSRETSLLCGLPENTPVAVSGHDHICGAFAVRATEPGQVFDSMGTAETLMGAIGKRAMGEKENLSGLSYGWHTVRDRMYWLGGLSASGGAIEWARTILQDPPLSYVDLDKLAQNQGSRPSGIVFFPYLAGSGSPHTDSRVKGAFVGLDMTHTRADLYQAILEGAAFEVEYIRRTAEEANGVPISSVLAAGGGTRKRSLDANQSQCQRHSDRSIRYARGHAAGSCPSGWYGGRNFSRPTGRDPFLPNFNQEIVFS